MIGNSVARVAASEVENKRRPLALNTFARLGIITVVAIGLMLVSHSLGWGVFGGLFVFQIILLTNAARSMAKGGPMTSVDDVITANVVEDTPHPAPAGRRAGRPHGRCLTMVFGSHLLTAPLLGIDITPGVHPQVKIFGLTFDVDIIWATVIAGRS